MSERLEIPGHEQRVSKVAPEGDQLVIRFISDFHPAGRPEAYCLQVVEPVDIGSVLRFLQELMAKDVRICLSRRDDGILLSAEDDDDEFLLRASAFSSQHVPPDAEELMRAIDRIHGWYELENATCTRLDAKLARIRRMLEEQANRVAIKSASHEDNSTAGVLYGQQQAFIRRLLFEFEASAD